MPWACCNLCTEAFGVEYFTLGCITSYMVRSQIPLAGFCFEIMWVWVSIQRQTLTWNCLVITKHCILPSKYPSSGLFKLWAGLCVLLWRIKELLDCRRKQLTCVNQSDCILMDGHDLGSCKWNLWAASTSCAWLIEWSNDWRVVPVHVSEKEKHKLHKKINKSRLKFGSIFWGEEYEKEVRKARKGEGTSVSWELPWQQTMTSFSAHISTLPTITDFLRVTILKCFGDLCLFSA